MTERSPALVRWLEFLDIADCPCSYEVQHLGRLHGVSMGDGWVRLSTDPACPHHGGK